MESQQGLQKARHDGFHPTQAARELCGVAQHRGLFLRFSGSWANLMEISEGVKFL
jgi:hypothetical protein